MIIDIPNIEDIPYILAYLERFKFKHIKGNSYTWCFTNPDIPPKSGVYLLYDENKQLLYIGQTSNLKTRISTHKQYIKPIYLKFIVIERSQDYLIGIEHILIDKYNPLLNTKERRRYGNQS